MPDHCFNRIRIETEKENILLHLKELLFKDNNFTMNKLLPMPKELEDTISPSIKPNKELIDKYGYDNWYDWKLNNWGTKWDAYEHSSLIEKSNNYLEQSFNTAWCPPQKFKEYLDKYIDDKYPDEYIKISWLWHDEDETIAGFS